MKQNIALENKLDYLSQIIIEQQGIIDFPWCSDELFYPYYLYFNDNHNRYSAGSLIAFWGLLIEWEDGSGFPFRLGEEIYNCYDFDKYMESFIFNADTIQIRFPNVFSVIVLSLAPLFINNDLIKLFNNIEEVKLRMYTNFVKSSKAIHDKDIYKQAFKEAGIQLDYS
ncbi:hypothetical protein Back11_17650 [Paenibacillus baekrokdamisoli]|uniref:Uncharacterized protein n=1 Tax=Paenibacillus baekrokdamisoli TaxID=1712516 RepID=A0A3G9INJ5_9BACL|nr:hypothetical protein [Paenibacillus baekrokdamisoli]MBB3073486.1 hypothetical protein [Paenibacillus baekrokdamisoli]BBH20420.1 hypothetical protein Back11_17650 [Paenibacillus baekrokdamisoli]